MGCIVTALRLVLAPMLKPAVLLVVLVAGGAVSYAALIRMLMPEFAATFMARLRRSRA